MAFLNATSQFRKIVGKMVSYFEDEFTGLTSATESFKWPRSVFREPQKAFERFSVDYLL